MHVMPSLPGQLYYRSLERDKIKALNENDKDYEGQATLYTLSRLDINWWIENIELKNGKLIRLCRLLDRDRCLS